MINDGIFIYANIIAYAKLILNHCLNNWNYLIAGELLKSTHAWFELLRARGHLLAMYWSYKNLVTLTLGYFPSDVHVGLWAVLQGLMVAVRVSLVLSYFNV